MLHREIQNTTPPFFEAVGCVVTTKHKTLLLKRSPDRSYPSRWGIPSGKVKKGETQIRAAIRELFEETGILVSSEQLTFVGTYHIVTDDMSFIYSLLACEFDTFPKVKVNPVEHVRINWFTPHDISRLLLMPDLEECLREALVVLRPRPIQLYLFPEQPDTERPSTYELEVSVNEMIAKEAANPISVAQGEWTASLGAPATGKTTAFRAIAKEHADLTLIKSRVRLQAKAPLNQYLRRVFEEDDRSCVLRLQLEMLLTRFRQSAFCDRNSLVIETIHGTLAHSRALYEIDLLSDDEYRSFYNYYTQFASLLPLPEKILYFHRTPKTLVKEIRQQARRLKSRSYERFYSDQYIFALSHCFDEVAIEIAKKIKVVPVNVDSLSTRDIASLYCLRTSQTVKAKI